MGEKSKSRESARWGLLTALPPSGIGAPLYSCGVEAEGIISFGFKRIGK